MEFLGVVTTGNTTGNTISFQNTSVVSTGSGMTMGTPVYASVTTPGGVQTTAPATVGYWLLQVGIAYSATSININAACSATAVKIAASNIYATVITNSSASLSVATTYDIILNNATSTAITNTLPTAVGITGKIFYIKKVDSSINAVTIATTSSQTIDGITTKVITTQYVTITVVSDGANWNII